MMMEEHPIGFRFYPTEEELVSFYLQNQLQGTLQDRHHRIIPVLNINNTEPWNLPQHAGELCRGEREQWFFFVPLQEREARGGRPSRSMPTGYWKVTGSPSYVYSSDNKAIGVKKSMVFYIGKPPTGRKTEWKLNEYRAFEVSSDISMPRLRHEYTLCRLHVVSGSSRAFDRRPLSVAAQEMTQGGGDCGVHRSRGAASTSSVVILDDHAGYSSTVGGAASILSVAQLDDHAGISDHGGTEAVTGAEEQPIWPDWEQFNWDVLISP